MTPADANVLIEQLALMNFFPNEPGARVALQRLLCRMCERFDQAQWTVDRMMDLYAKWPGPTELRAVYCSRFKPADGVNTYSQIYIDGIPPTQNSAPPPIPALPPGHIASADPELESSVRDLAARKDLNRK